jgi:telomeric repeat-binding factor 2-interacting protein 1
MPPRSIAFDTFILIMHRYSYQYIEKSIQRGKLEDLEAHKAGPSAARPVGATNIPARKHRSTYTPGDDQLIFDYMQPFERDPKASISGNKIYQEFAAQVFNTQTSTQ